MILEDFNYSYYHQAEDDLERFSGMYLYQDRTLYLLALDHGWKLTDSQPTNGTPIAMALNDALYRQA